MSYNRSAALRYAEIYSFRVCHDGRVATQSGYPGGTPGSLIEVQGAPWAGIADDCTHFISCCIGASVPDPGNPTQRCGGGLEISQPFRGAGVFGHTYVPALLGELLGYTPGPHGFHRQAQIVGPQFRRKTDASTAADIESHLQRGDLLAYAEKGDMRHPENDYRHFAILVKETKIACHTMSRYDADFTLVGWDYVTLVKML